MTYILILVFGLFISISLTYCTIQWAKKKQLFELTDERKIHTEKVSALGGVALFISFWSMVFLLEVSMAISLPIFAATSLLFAIGMLDDLVNVGILPRLLLQSLAAAIACYAGFHFTISTGEWGMLINYGISIFFILLLINSINFMDGINGLAGGIGLISMGVFGSLFFLLGMFDLVLMVAAFMVALSGFLVFNYGEKAAIFMGDNGSTVLGFILAIFAMKGTQVFPMSENVLGWTLIAAVLSIPILDLCAVVFIRAAKGISPLKADRIHIHHLITDSGLTHPESCKVIWTWLMLLIVCCFVPIKLPMFSMVICSYILLRTKYTPTTPFVYADLEVEKQRIQHPLSA